MIFNSAYIGYLPARFCFDDTTFALVNFDWPMSWIFTQIEIIEGAYTGALPSELE